jgi:hypothetical protein
VANRYSRSEFKISRARRERQLEGSDEGVSRRGAAWRGQSLLGIVQHVRGTRGAHVRTSTDQTTLVLFIFVKDATGQRRHLDWRPSENDIFIIRMIQETLHTDTKINIGICHQGSTKPLSTPK